MNDNVMQKIAEHYYIKGLNLAIKEAKLPGGFKAVGKARDSVSAAEEAKDKTTLKDQLIAGGKGFAKSYVKSIIDPRVPKKESTTGKVTSVLGDVASLAYPGIETPAAALRLGQRHINTVKSNNKMLNKMRKSPSKIERDAAQAYNLAHPKMGIN